MFKRSTKITSLLVTAASVISMVPAMAADVKRIDAVEGKVYNAFAYKDGNFYVDGKIDDNEDVFHYTNGKFEKVSDLDSDSDAELYGEKYVKVDDGDYYVDLTSGKVTDDDKAEDDEDSAASALRKNIKKDTDDRFDENEADDIQDLTLLSGNKFGESWFRVTKGIKPADKNKGSLADGNFDVYTDKNGKYIDADYNLGKIKVETSRDSVNVENTKDSVNLDGVKDAISASVSDAKYLTQDSKYVYRKAKITIKSNADKNGNLVGITKVFGIDVREDNAFNDTKAGDKVKEVSFDVIQKISKAQASGDVDGVKYAKEVTNYVISKDDGKTQDNDKKDVLDAALADTEDYGYTVAGGKLVAYGLSSEKKLDTVTIDLNKKKNLTYTDLKGKSSEDCKDFDIDVEGNIWRLDSGNLYKWDNDDDWDKVYKVDGSMSKLSVYDKNNLVVWDEDDEVYSLLGGKSKEEEKPAEPATPAITQGWNKAADGTYTYVNADGTKKTGWFFDTTYNHYYYLDPTTGVMKANTWFFDPAYGHYYYLDASGAMKANTWFFDPAYGHDYYFDGSGAMQTGWFNDGNDWYYADGSGAMLSNTIVDGYRLGASGAWIR